MSRLRRAVMRSRGDSGESLPEMLVVVGLLAIVGVVVAAAMTTGLRTTRHVTTLTGESASLQVAADAAARDLRAAEPCPASVAAFTAATSTSVTFCANFPGSIANTAPVTITLALTGTGSFTETITPQAGVAVTRQLAAGITVGSNPQVFTYYPAVAAAAASASPIPVPVVPVNALAAGSVSAGALGSIDLVGIKLVAGPTKGPSNDIAQVTGSTLVNLPGV